MMIDFAAANWFDQYVVHRKEHPVRLESLLPLAPEVRHGLEERFKSLQHPFYLALQSSGLIYGFPIEYPFQNADQLDIRRLPSRRRAKLILLDMMLHAHMLEGPWPAASEYSSVIEREARCIREYYRGIQVYGRQKNPDVIEAVLLRRVRYRRRYLDFRRSGLNSHLFWELYFFLEYSRRCEDPAFTPEAYFPELLERKKAMKTLTLQLLVATTHADRRITTQEKKLYQHFHQSSQLLSAAEKQTLQDLFQRGVRLEQLDIPSLDWLARRFLLDVCLLAIHADAQTDQREEHYLQELRQRLQLSEADLLASEADLGSFLYQYGKKLHFFRARKTGLRLLARAAIDNFTQLAGAAKMEYVETRDMASIFSRLLAQRLRLSQRNDLPNETEIRAAFDQLKDIPKFLPFFSFIFMPVPGITEVYILLAFSLEKLSGGNISLLPSQIQKAMGKKAEKETDKTPHPKWRRKNEKMPGSYFISPALPWI